MINMSATKHFDQLSYDFGERNLSEQVEFSFPVLGGTVEHVRKGCGCTDAYFDNGHIKGVIDLSSAVGEMDDDENKRSIIKTVTVYFKDGKNLKVKNGLKNEYNINKSQETLSIRGVVVNDSPEVKK